MGSKVSILAPILFSVFTNDSGKDVQAELHLYADDAIIYPSAPSAELAIEEFQSLQRAKFGSKIGPKCSENKVCLQSIDNLGIFTSDGTLIERVSSYKYMG